jgi:hypothetical protein
MIRLSVSDILWTWKKFNEVLSTCLIIIAFYWFFFQRKHRFHEDVIVVYVEEEASQVDSHVDTCLSTSSRNRMNFESFRLTKPNEGRKQRSRNPASLREVALLWKCSLLYFFSEFFEGLLLQNSLKSRVVVVLWWWLVARESKWMIMNELLEGNQKGFVGKGRTENEKGSCPVLSLHWSYIFGQRQAP